MRWRILAVGMVFLAGTYLFGGKYGLLAGGGMLLAALAFRLPPGGVWIVSLVLLGAAPIAIMAAGLPHTPVVGAGFGERHLAAHVLVGLAMAAAALAGLLEIARWSGTTLPRGSTGTATTPAGEDGRPSDRGSSPQLFD